MEGYDSPFDLRDFFQGYLEQLRVEGRHFSDNIHHSGEKGRLNETHISQLLRKYLPKKYGVGTGFIASANPKIKRSPQCDIIIYDAVNNAPLYESEAFSIYPIEIVYAVIEVKTDIRKEFDDCLSKCAHIRSMSEEIMEEVDFNKFKSNPSISFGYSRRKDGKYVLGYKGYYRNSIKKGNPTLVEYFETLPPRFYIFSYYGWKNPQNLERNFRTASEKFPGSHIHGTCVLNEHGGYFIRHLAYRTGDNKIGPILKQNGFIHFLLSLPKSLETMLPPYPRRLGLSFDLVNLDRYRIRTDESDRTSKVGNQRKVRTEPPKAL